MIDLTKLTPAPWEADESHIVYGRKGTLRETPGFAKFESEHRNTDAEFTALARNAFDVMIRRGWSAVCDLDQWAIQWNQHGIHIDEVYRTKRWPDPFTALVEADEWYKANVEGKVQP
jgi:hypothetical protein